MSKTFLISGFFLAALSVALGAFGAHGLKKITTPNVIDIYETAVKYQMYHALAIIITGVLFTHLPAAWLTRAAWLFILGILLFCGSLYVIVALKIKDAGSIGPLGALTPIGGLFFILGWLALCVAAIKK